MGHHWSPSRATTIHHVRTVPRTVVLHPRPLLHFWARPGQIPGQSLSFPFWWSGPGRGVVETLKGSPSPPRDDKPSSLLPCAPEHCEGSGHPGHGAWMYLSLFNPACMFTCMQTCMRKHAGMEARCVCVRTHADVRKQTDMQTHVQTDMHEHTCVDMCFYCVYTCVLWLQQQ